MAESAGDDTTFTLDVVAGDHAPSTGRLFVATVLRTLDADEGTVDDAKLAVSEAITAAIMAGHPQVSVAVDGRTGLVRIEPLTRDDLAGDPFDVVSALFPGATTDAGLQFTIPVGGSTT